MDTQTEIKKVITVDLGNTATSLKDYKKHIDDLRGSLLQLDESSEEYAKVAKEIETEQNKLNDVMQVGKKNTDAAEGSYNHLTKTMSELKKQWKATTDETERAEIGKKILEINNELKKLDATTGNYQRNVGDYANQMAQSFASLPGPIGKVSSATAGLGAKLKMLLANPVVAIIGAVTAAMATLIKSIKGNEEQMQKLHKVFAVFEPVVNLVKNAITKVADVLVNNLAKAAEKVMSGITKLVTAFKNLAENLGWDELAAKAGNFLDMQKQSLDLAERENKLAKETRDNKVEEARLESEIAELRAKMTDKETYTLEQRKKFADEWEKKSKRLLDIELRQAQQELDIIKERNSQAQNSSKDYDAEAEAQIRLYNVQQRYQESLRTLVKTKQSLISEGQKLASTQDDITDAMEGTIEAAAESVTIEDIMAQIFRESVNRAIEKAKDNKETAALMKEWLSTQFSDISLSEDSETFDVENDPQIFWEAERQQKILDITLAAMDQKIAAQQTYVDSLKEMNMETDEEEKKLAEMREQRRQAEILGSKKVRDAEIADRQAVYKQAAQLNSLITSTAGAMFDALIEMSEEGSEEQKQLQIAQAVVNTIGGAVGAFLQGMASYPAPYGAIIGGVAAAAATAAGIAQIAKMKSTSKNSASASGASVSAPEMSMTSVSPLLDEQSDINRMTTLSEERTEEQPAQRVYVLEQDITESQRRVRVVEDNATF